MITCSKCQKSKNESEFYSGMKRCKSCHKMTCNGWAKRNPEKVKASQDKWSSKPENKKKQVIAARRWQLNNVERVKLNKRRLHIKKTYGISLEEYDRLATLQNNCCKICNKYQDILHVDHDHVTGEVRGLLCLNCNTGLGLFSDSVETLNNAISYLKK